VLWRAGVSRTTIIAGVVILILLILAGILLYQRQLAPTTTTPISPSPPPVERIVTIGVTDKVTDLDPAQAYDFFTWEVLSNVMAGLVKYDPDTGDIVGDLAVRWEVQEDGKVWIFYLRRDARFADGLPCTARDVVRSIERVMRIQGDPSWLVTEFVDKVEAVDNYTVKFTLKTPASYFLALVATPPYYPVHPNYPPDKVASDATWGGCGPYKIAEWVRDERLVLVPNPYYYGGKPKNDRVVIIFYKTATALRNALEAGQVNVAWRTLNPEDIDALRRAGFKVVEVPGLFIRYVVIKTDVEPTKEKLVRQALAAAVNRVEIAQIVFKGTVEPLYSMVPKGMWSHADVFKDKYGDGNLELAKQLLRQAGYSEAKKLRIELWYTPTHYGDTEAQLAALLKEQWERTGMISVEVKSSEWAQYVSQLRQGLMMVSLLGWYPDYLDPDDYLTPFLMSTANKWTGTGYSNSIVDELLKNAQLSTSKSERTKLYEEVQKILAEDVPYIPLIQGKLYVVVSGKIVNLKISPLMFLLYDTIEVSG